MPGSPTASPGSAVCSESSIAFAVHWTQRRDELGTLYTAACERFFKSLECTRHARVHISDISPRPGNGAFEDKVFQVVCTVALDNEATPSKLGVLYAKIARHWCKAGRSPAYRGKLQLLVPDHKPGLPRDWMPYENSIQLTSLSFGTFANLTVFAENFVVHSRSEASGFALKCVFKHDEKVLQVSLDLKHHEICRRMPNTYRLVITYDSIHRVLIDDCEGSESTTDIFLYVRTIPLLYKRNEQRTVVLTKSTNPELHFFDRALELGCGCHSIWHAKDLGGNAVVKLGFRNKLKVRQIIGPLSRRCNGGTRFQHSAVTTRSVGSSLKDVQRLLDSQVMPHLGYSCCYALKAVLQQGNDAAAQMAMWPDNEREEFVHSILEFAHENEGALEQALFIIRDAIEKGNVVTLHAALPELFHQFRKVHSPDIVPAGSYLIRRLFVTPSRVFFLPPLLFRENRVLRRFNPEYAMRVTFRDDNLQQLSRSLMFHRRRDEMVDAIVGKFLREGVVVGDRRFKFLATSCSQLRDHGAWLYAEDSSGNTVDLIRTWMGDFSGIPNIAKKMARMGQCFSSTMETLKVPLKGNIVQVTPDIVGGLHPVSAKEFSFSDGIGMISASLMEKVCKKVGLSSVPCAIQIRYAGYKGMLCLNPCLQGDKLVLRPSMRKFDCSSSDSLELVKVSAPRLVCLNRPLITILEQLGVPSRVFLCLQQSTVLQCTDALVCESTALQVLSGFGGTSLPFAELVRGGFCLTRDPFVRSLLYAVYKNTMDGLRSKSRIAVPPNTGRNMLGVLDETQSLEYGEVFVQFTEHVVDDGSSEDDPKVPTTKILVGAVLVTKCPCLHPGDVRKFAAVDVPGLHHVKDCIVFPAKGPRPHPNEMAGSDLDGDEYIVIWEKDLLFPGKNQPAMVFCDHSSVVSSDDSLEEGMVKFICNYIKNDNVGILSNAHLAWADKLPDGIFSKRCLNIAAKISTCIDFAKTGTTSHLTREEKPSVYPDFMEKAGSKDTYRSTRILGHLYRLHRYLDSVLSTNFQSRLAEDVNGVLFELPGWQCYQKTAQESLTLYSSQMERILCQYGIKSEGEVVAGLITTVSDYNRSTLDRNNVEVVVVQQYRALVESTRVHFFKEVDDACLVGGVSTEVGRKVILLQMASAWYKVTYADAWKERNCRSFPWAIVDVLLLVMKEKASGSHSLRRVPRNLLVSKLDEELRGPSEKTTEDRALDVIFLWAAKEELIQTTRRMAPYICKRCLALLFGTFLAQERSCSEYGSEQRSGQLAVNGVEMPHSIEGKPATVGGYVLAFLRHLSSAEVAFPSCDLCTWSSSQAHAVTLTALRTYSLLAIFGDLCYLGLTCDPDLHEPIQVVQEGNPVRIQVISPRFREMLNHSEDEVSSLLASWSGVQQVHIKKHLDRSGQINCILVLAVGRDWQRWFLEELLLQPWLAKAIEKRDLEPFLKD